MIPKTAKQIQTDVYNLLVDSELAKGLSGSVYRGGMRPRDSRLEDAVVVFTTGLPTQIQEGVVTVNIFVADVKPYKNGVFVEDGKRLSELEQSSSLWVGSLNKRTRGYTFELMQTIYSEQEAEMRQHFVVVKLRYRYFGENDGV